MSLLARNQAKEDRKRRIREWRLNPVRFVWDNFKVDPDIWQKEFLEAFASEDKDKQRISLNACAGPGKAQPNSMVLNTPEGSRLWGGLKVGDFVFAPDGGPARIVGVHPRGSLPVSRVCFDDGSSTRCCAEHLWQVLKPQDRDKRGIEPDGRVLTTDEIKFEIANYGRGRKPIHKRRRLSIPCHSSVRFFREEKLPLDSYVLGAWLGDGGRCSGRGSWLDKEIDDEIISRGYEISRSTDRKAVTVHGASGFLREIGVFHCYSYEKFIPEIYKFSTPKSRKDLLCGLMDTDGCIGKDSAMEFDSTSKRLAEDVVWLVRSLGGKARMSGVKKTWYRNKKGVRVDCRDLYRVSLCLNFNPFFVLKKSARWKKPQDRYLTRYFSEIKEDGFEESMCIEVFHPSSCYLSNDFIVTHNSAGLAWAGWNFLSCYGDKGMHPKGAAVSTTQVNLEDNLWPEFSKWRQRSSYLMEFFEWSAKAVYCKEFEDTWFISARTWNKSASPEEQGRTLSGLHSEYVLVLVDESGDIPISVLKSGEQAMSRCRWGKIVQAGNPISHVGMLYAAATELADQWYNINITGDPDDPKRSKRIDIDWAREMIRKHGRHDPWVMAYILGVFPEAGFNQLLGPEEVRFAMERNIDKDKFAHAQKRIGIDSARFGDDPWIFFPRQGLMSYPCLELRGLRTAPITARLIRGKHRFGSEMEFLDVTGGYGDGVADAMVDAGYPTQEINFSSKAANPRYFNKRAEMWFLMADWIRAKGQLPKDPILKKELCAPMYTFQSGKMKLEEKDQIKKRLGFSPNRADSLALTFALPEQATADVQEVLDRMEARRQDREDYDPLAFEHVL